MFLESSRYAKVPVAQIRAADGRTVSALGLRRLPATAGEPRIVRGHDRLDLLAHGIDGDGTRWWHVADANTALDAHVLTDEMGATIRVPES